MFENYIKKLISLDEGEEIHYITHHHWITFSKTLIKILVPPTLLITFILFFRFGFFESLLNSSLLSILALVILIIWVTYSLYHWYIWFFDMLILTNKKIIAIDQKGIFNKSLRTALLSKTQDINIEYKGILENILRYGTLLIHTAGEENGLKLVDIPLPQEVSKKILNLKDNFPEKEKDEDNNEDHTNKQ